MTSSSFPSVEPLLSRDGSDLYLFFGGIANGIAIPPFEFFGSAGILEQHKIFFRDLDQNWYHQGFRGVTGDIRSSAKYIEGLIEEISPRQTFFIGNSMGGFAAMLFSTLVGAGDVIAFSPQTFVSPHLKVFYRDLRWRNQILDMYIKALFKPKFFDLRPLLEKRELRNKVTIYSSRSDPLDFIHADRVSHIPNVNVNFLDDAAHNVVKILRDKGLLHKIFLNGS